MRARPAKQGRFERVKCIGKGSYGEALLVRQRVDGKLMVIKRIPVAKLTAKEREAVINEAQLLSGLDHCNIIGYHTAYTTPKHCCIVLDFADGGDLSQRIESTRARGQRLNKAVVLDWFAQLCSAMNYVHSRNILHRDLKAANIFLTKELIIKLGDFGIAKELTSSKALAETVIGTPYYMSPELCEDQPYGEKSDVWAMGCVLYELMALTLPFTGSNLAGLVVKIIRGRYAPVPPQYGEEAAALTACLLEREPRVRPTVRAILDTAIVAKALARFERRFKTLSERAERAKRPLELDATIVSPRYESPRYEKPLSPPSAARGAAARVASPLRPGRGAGERSRDAGQRQRQQPAPSPRGGGPPKGRDASAPSPSLRDKLLRQASRRGAPVSVAESDASRRRGARRSRVTAPLSPSPSPRAWASSAASAPTGAAVRAAPPSPPPLLDSPPPKEPTYASMQSPLQQHIARARAERRAAPESSKSPAQRRKSPTKSPTKSPGGYPGKSRRSPATRRVASAAGAAPSPRAEATRAREEEVRAAAMARRAELSARKKLFRKEKRLEKEQQRAEEAERQQRYRVGLKAAKAGRSSLKDDLRARRREMKRASAASAASSAAGEGGGGDANDRRFDVEVLVPKAFASALGLPGASEDLFAAAEAEERALLCAAAAAAAARRGSGGGSGGGEGGGDGGGGVGGKAERRASVAPTSPRRARRVEAVPDDALAVAELEAARATERLFAVAESPNGSTPPPRAARASRSRAPASSAIPPATPPEISPAISPTTTPNDVDSSLTDLSERMGILAIHFGSGAPLPPTPPTPPSATASGAPGAARRERERAPLLETPSTAERLRASCLDHFGASMLAKVYAYVREIGVAAYDTDPAARASLEEMIGSKAIRQVDLVSMLIAAEDIEDAMVLKAEAAEAPPAAAAAAGELVIG